jgi:hypothetical protein
MARKLKEDTEKKKDFKKYEYKHICGGLMGL